jgi:hypothetical protein
MLLASGAVAAELPSRAAKAKPPEAKARTCEIGGESGFQTPGGGCVRIGGYVSVGVSSGSLRR